MQIGFTSPIHIINSEIEENLLKNVIKDIYTIRDNDTGFNVSNNLGWHSTPDLFLRNEVSIKEVCKICASSIGSIMKNYNPEFNAENFDARFVGWINVNPKGGSNNLHTHPNSHWSGVLYVQQPTEVEGYSGMIEFINPNQEGRDLANLIPQRGFDPIMRIRPKSGQLVIFPSYLLHSVYPNNSDTDRITIAFNSQILKK